MLAGAATGAVALIRIVPAVIARSLLAVVAPVLPVLARQRSGQSSWSGTDGDPARQRRHADRRFASPRVSMQRRRLGGALIAFAAVMGGVALVRSSRVPEQVRVAVDARRRPTGQQVVVDERPYSSLPAGMGLDWVDQAQEDKNRLILPPDVVGGYGTADYRSDTINIVDGERATVLPAKCDCVPREVWLVGGSAAFGSGQRDDHTIASELVRAAGADGVSLRVRNLGVPGFTLWQEYLLVVDRLLRSGSPPDLLSRQV